MKKVLLFWCTLSPTLVLAAQPVTPPFTYAPETCEFQITFPEKPFIENKCTQNTKTATTDCVEVVTFTKAVGIDSSTHFRVTCNKLDSEAVKTYTPEIIEETVSQLAKSNHLIPYDIKSDESNGYKNASILSLSERDGKSLIYNAQIWIGKKSMFTLEAEMLGASNEDIQSTFADILRNTYPKDNPPKADKKE